MFKSLSKKIQSLRQGLTRLDNQPIGLAALTVVLLLDLFILSSIFRGLDDHTAQLSSPAEYVPSYCRQVLIERGWNDDNRLQRLGTIVLQYRNEYLRAVRESKETLQPLCQSLGQPIAGINKNEDLSRQFAQYMRTRDELDEARSDHTRIKGVYDSALLESVARGQSGANEYSGLAEENRLMTARVAKLLADESTQAETLKQAPQVIGLFSSIDAVTDAERDLLRAELRSLNFWYPAKRLGMEMLFLLPLVLVFYFWNSRSIAASRPLQSLVSSHLLVIAFVPVLFKLVELVYDIIPKTFIEHVIAWLVSLRLVAVWHYLLMAVAIVSALALVYVLHKKLFSRERLIDRRIARGQCQDCGTHLPVGAQACPFCGFKQFHNCPTCHQSTFVHGRHCQACGEKT